jgi:Ca2+-binding EF-hand superfamily protein
MSSDLRVHYEAFAQFSGTRDAKSLERAHFINMCKDLELNLTEQQIGQLFACSHKDQHGHLVFEMFVAEVLPKLSEESGKSVEEIEKLMRERSPRAFHSKLHDSQEAAALQQGAQLQG